jgi:aspartate beta-hydroxylase
VDRALTGYLREWDATPPDARQRPKFFFFPDIPTQPYHDPFLQPWAQALQDAFPIIRGEALGLLGDAGPFRSSSSGRRPVSIATGEEPQPAWEAFFFYRHRRPQSPALSSSAISNRSRAVPGGRHPRCCSVLRPGTHIIHGVTNTRLVMHLTDAEGLRSIVDAGTGRRRTVDIRRHRQHEAWNHRASTRVIVLMV